MKKGSLNFLGRKNQSLFDTNVDINKDLANVKLVLDSAAIPESGTAKVRSRPTVKHFTSSDSVQGFAVPTPKVPVLPPFNEPKINGTGSTTNLPNGRMLSIPDVIEGEILIPPPPSSAPPPPPSSAAPPPPSFIPSSPQFFGQMDPSVDSASLQPPPMVPPKPPFSGSNYGSNLDLASLKPPPMAPPKPPSEMSSIRGSLSSLEISQDIPECPKFTPPPPPVGKTSPVLAKAQKAAPPKPIRMSSISNMEIHPQIPAQSVVTPSTLSSFRPQNTAKLYNVQKSTLLDGQTDRDIVQSILLLEDSAGNTVGVVNGNSGKNAGSFQPAQPGLPPTKPARQSSSANQLKDDEQDTTEAPSQPAKVEAKVIHEPTQNIPSEVPTPIRVSPKIEKKTPDVRQVMAPVESPGRSRRYSPVVKHRQFNTRGVDSSAKKDTSTSPFALLMAAKEREKQRTSVSHQNSNSMESVGSVIQPSADKPNSFTVIPRDQTPDSPSAQIRSTTNLQPITSQSTNAEIPKLPYVEPKLSSSPQRSIPMDSSVGALGVPVRDVESGEDLTFIPPPPEFANSDTEDEPPVPPPSYPAPAPSLKTVPPPIKTFSSPASVPLTNCSLPNHLAPTSPSPKSSVPATPAPITNVPSHPAPATLVKTAPPPAKLVLPTSITNGPSQSHHAPDPPPSKPVLPPTPSPVKNGPQVSPKPKPPSGPPKAPAPPPNLHPQSKSFVYTKPTQPPVQAPTSVAANQATLLSILQKKMLEMDPKLSAVKEVESSGDDWNSPLSDDESTSPPAAYNPIKTRSATLPVQSRGLDMKELENKAAKKAQDIKSQNSNGPSSKQQYGMTFTVRPGSKQPITPVIKDGSP